MFTIPVRFGQTKVGWYSGQYASENHSERGIPTGEAFCAGNAGGSARCESNAVKGSFKSAGRRRINWGVRKPWRAGDSSELRNSARLLFCSKLAGWLNGTAGYPTADRKRFSRQGKDFVGHDAVRASMGRRRLP